MRVAGWLVLLAACEDVADVRSSPIPSVLSSRQRLQWDGPVVAIAQTEEHEHHATAWVSPRGDTLLVHNQGSQVSVRWLRPDLSTLWQTILPGVANHPQVGPAPVDDLGLVAIGIGPAAGPIFAQTAGPDGLQGEPLQLSTSPLAYYPDFDRFDDRVVAVWADGEKLSGGQVGPDTVTPLGDLASDRGVDPPTVRASATAAWVAWSPAVGDDFRVELRPLGPDGAWGEGILVDERANVGSARAGVAVGDEGGATVVWRWLDGPDPNIRQPVGSWVRRYDIDGVPLGAPFPLPGPRADRPVVVAAGDEAVVAWEADDTLWLQRFDPIGEPLGEPLLLITEPVPERAYLDLRRVHDRWEGRLTWESEGADGLDVFLRAFTLVD